VTVFLELQVGLKEDLWAHLLQNDVEQVAIVFAAVETTGDTTVFVAKDAYLATADCFEIHSEFHVELNDEARARIIKRAWDTGTSPVEFHSHPGDYWGAMFSLSDLHGFSDYVPHCRWRLRGRPYLAVVVCPAGVDALAWTGAGGEPVGVDAIRPDGGAVIVPTNQTIEKLKSEVPEYGPGTL
jgi:hypothetical protein